MLHRRRQGNQKENCHGGATIIPVTNHGSTDRIWSSNVPRYAATFLKVIQGYWRNQLQRNSVNMMGTYDPAEPLVRIIDQLEKGQNFSG